MIPYRNPQELGKQEFNQKISHARIIVEHVMGILKGRWCSLRPKSILTEKVNSWILSRLILHNMVTQFNDDWSDEMESGSDVSGDVELEESGIEFRERIRESLKFRIVLEVY